MQKRLGILVLVAGLVASAAHAGTAYINFDGDDGSGSSLPAGCAIGTDGGGSVTISGGVAQFPGGGEFIDFPFAWLESGNVVIEYTVQNVGAFLADTAPSYAVGMAAAGDGGLWFSAIADPPGTGTSNITAFDFGLGSQSMTDLNVFAPTDKATVRAVIDVGGAVSVYVALDADATTSSGRAREEDFIHMGQYGWGAFKANAYYFRFQAWGKAITIDDIIMEGADVPDFGTTPAMAAPTFGTTYLTFDGDDGLGSSLTGSIAGHSAAEAQTVFAGDALEIGPNQWGGGCYLTMGMFPRGPFTLEFTIQNPADVATYNATWGWVLGLQMIDIPQTNCLYPGGVFDGIGWEAGDTPEIAVAGCGATADSLTQQLTAATKATIKIAVDPDANTSRLYVAFDDDATTASARATNLTLVDTYPWGSWANGPTLFRMVAYSVGSSNADGRLVLDDVIIDGVGVPQFGPAPPAIDIPDLSGLSQSEAVALLAGLGFSLGTVTPAYSDTEPSGRVLGQDPAPGSAAAQGTPINIVVSAGPAPTPEMPVGGAIALVLLGGAIALGGAIRLGRKK